MTCARGRAVAAARPLGVLVVAALAAGSATSAAAQTALDARAVAGWRGPSDATGGPGLDLSGTAGLDHLFAAGRGTLRFALQADRTPGDEPWSSRLSVLSASWRADLASHIALYVRGEGVLRLNDGAWADSGFRGMGGGGTLEWRNGSWLNLRLGADLATRDFPELPELDQRQADGFVAVRLNGSTRTTLIADGRVGAKRYAATRSAAAMLSGPGGSRGGGGGHVPVTRLLETTAPRTARASSVLVRAAQGLTEGLGVWVQLDRRWVGGDVPPLLLAAPPALLDDGVYDDPYATARTSWRAGVTWRGTSGGGVSVSGGWDRRSPTMAGLDGGPATERIRRLAIEADWPLAQGSGLDLSAIARYDHLRRTGAAPESYRSGAAAAGVRVGF